MRHWKMQSSNILYLSDRAYLTDKTIPQAVLDTLHNHGLIAPDMQKINFCGVLSYCDGLVVFLPRNHGVVNEGYGRAGHFLLQALLKYYQRKTSGIYAQDGGEEVIGGRSLSLAISLLEDYRANGLYVRRVKERTTNTGKVNWSRTISRNTPYPSGDDLVYLDLSSSRSRYFSNCETAKIHAQVIKELFIDYGLLWLGSSEHIDDSLTRFSKPLASIKAQISYLQRELHLSYSERDMSLIKGLIQYLSLNKGTKKNNLLIGVSKFHNLWESMLDECLVGKYDVNRKLPIPIYQTCEDKFIPVAQKGQRTDTVLKHDNQKLFAVVDAKYYEARTPQTAPGWSDLVKQFYYQKAVSLIEGDDAVISNHFIFPGCFRHLKAAHVAERDVTVKSKDDCLEEYSVIHCHYQAPIELLKAYVKGEKLIKLTEEIFNQSETMT